MSTNSFLTVKAARVGTIIEIPKPLPNPITTLVFCFLSISDLNRVSQVSKTWNEFTTSNTQLWQSINLKKLFPLLVTPQNSSGRPSECPCDNKTIAKATVLFLRKVFKTGERHEEEGRGIICISSRVRSHQQKESHNEDYKPVVKAGGTRFTLGISAKKDAYTDESTALIQKYMKPIFEACLADVDRTKTISPLLIRSIYLGHEYEISVLRFTNKEDITFRMPVPSPWVEEEVQSLLDEDWSCMIDGVPPKKETESSSPAQLFMNRS